MSSEQNFREGALRVFIRSSAFTEKVNTILGKTFYMALAVTCTCADYVHFKQ